MVEWSGGPVGMAIGCLERMLGKGCDFEFALR